MGGNNARSKQRGGSPVLIKTVRYVLVHWNGKKHFVNELDRSDFFEADLKEKREFIEIRIEEGSCFSLTALSEKEWKERT